MVCVWIDLHTGSESCTFLVVRNHLYGAFLLSFLWSVILLCLVLSVLGILGCSHVCMCIS